MDFLMPNLQCFVVALIPLVVGFIWYSPFAFANAWMKHAGIDPNMKPTPASMAIIFSITYVLGLMAAIWIKLNTWGHPMEQRDFFHGAFHAVLVGAFIGLPMLVTNGLFERKSIQYHLINIGYWAIAYGLMGGVMMIWQPASTPSH